MKITAKSFAYLPACLMAFALMPARPAWAQELTNNDSARLPVVTVIAQKEPQSAATLPLSVTPVTRDTLEDADIHTVRDASIYAPNTFVNEFSARAVSNPFFRGIGGSPLNPGVTTFIDGVPQ